MHRQARHDIPRPLLLATTGLALLLAHVAAYDASRGISPFDAAALAAVGHGPLWLLFAVAIGAAMVAAIVATRARATFAERADGTPPLSGVLEIGRVWILLLVTAVVGFVVLENVESLMTTGTLAGLAPVAWIAHLAAIQPVLVGTALLALLVVAVARIGRVGYARVLQRSYASLVAQGVFTSTFRQSPWAIAFVESLLDANVPRREGTVRLLECGCGSGFWLETLAAWASRRGMDAEIAGFDLSPELVAEARRRLDGAGIDAAVELGDVLAAPADTGATAGRFDLVLAYDVVQQLPADVQGTAVRAMLERVAPGGTLIVADHDRRTRYGRTMGAKKWLRRYLGVPLVPAYYIHARYPDLGRIAGSLRADGRVAQIVVEAEGRKRALVVLRS